jgi:hypothetical protein
MLDVVQPYIVTHPQGSVTRHDPDLNFMVRWAVRGCFSVNTSSVHWGPWPANAPSLAHSRVRLGSCHGCVRVDMRVRVRVCMRVRACVRACEATRAAAVFSRLRRFSCVVVCDSRRLSIRGGKPTQSGPCRGSRSRRPRAGRPCGLVKPAKPITEAQQQREEDGTYSRPTSPRATSLLPCCPSSRCQVRYACCARPGAGGRLLPCCPGSPC